MARCHEQQAVSPLRDARCSRGHNAVLYGVPVLNQSIYERPENLSGPSPPPEARHVFHNNVTRSVFANDASELDEQGASRFGSLSLGM
jgi:hypothetical protein